MAKKKKEAPKYFWVSATVTLDLEQYQIEAKDEEDAKKKFEEIFKSELGMDVSGNNLIQKYEVDYLMAQELDEDEIDLDLIED